MSIRRLVKKGRTELSIDGAIPTAEILALEKEILGAVLAPTTVNVNIGGVEEGFKGVLEGKEPVTVGWVEALPRTVPPFQQMWLEWRWDKSGFKLPDLPVGFLVRRFAEGERNTAVQG